MTWRRRACSRCGSTSPSGAPGSCSRPLAGPSPERMNIDRRSFLGAAATTIAAVPVVPARASATPSSPVKQVKAGLLDVGYVEAGPAGGAPVLLLHGWPYDIHSFDEVAPI